MLIGKLTLRSPFNNFSAIIKFAASVGWYASQNTYLPLSSHRTELPFTFFPLKQTNGGKYPPQHGSLAFSNPKHPHKISDDQLTKIINKLWSCKAYRIYDNLEWCPLQHHMNLHKQR